MWSYTNLLIDLGSADSHVALNLGQLTHVALYHTSRVSGLMWSYTNLLINLGSVDSHVALNLGQLTHVVLYQPVDRPRVSGQSCGPKPGSVDSCGPIPYI